MKFKLGHILIKKKSMEKVRQLGVPSKCCVVGYKQTTSYSLLFFNVTVAYISEYFHSETVEKYYKNLTDIFCE